MIADEYMLLVKGAETSILDRLASGLGEVTLDHINEYAEVIELIVILWISSRSPWRTWPPCLHSISDYVILLSSTERVANPGSCS